GGSTCRRRRGRPSSSAPRRTSPRRCGGSGDTYGDGREGTKGSDGRMSDRRPIGIFDSGVGGLTVARAVFDLLPNEPIVYLGDNGRFPYGPRPLQEIRTFALEIAGYLAERDVKMLVVAC